MSSAASPPPPWTELPSDLTANILQRLGAVEILQNAQFVCATWWKVCHDPSLWRVIEIEKSDRCTIKYDDHMITMMCRRAVDLSQGQLIDLSIAYFGNDDLLHYIFDRSSHLQRLSLGYCYDIRTATLIEAVKKLEKLEEMHLFFPRILAGDVEAIGNACPMLKSFTFKLSPILHRSRFIEGSFGSGNEKAVAIAKTMPNLHHLVLIGINGLNNEGLLAILDGCPRLESLDLRQCFGVNLRGPLGQRCCKQIKHLRRPTDSIWF